MSKPNLGAILDPTSLPVRDAVHVPIVPVVAEEVLDPGARITVHRREGVLLASKIKGFEKVLGIVDPYLSQPVNPGELFYCLVKPNTVLKLWHEWRHRDFDKADGR